MVRRYSKLLPLFGILLSLSAAKAAPPSFDGKWQTSCYPQASQHIIDTMDIKGNDVSLTVEGFSDATCSTPSMAVQLDGTAQIGAESIYAKGANEVDSTTSKILSDLLRRGHDRFTEGYEVLRHRRLGGRGGTGCHWKNVRLDHASEGG